jgi:RNA polymerase sigma factor (sigma-70 family)
LRVYLYSARQGSDDFVKNSAVRVDGGTFNDHLGLAKVIALEYTNIPGVTADEAVSEAHQALLRASGAFDPTKGEFTPYAARSIRNALNSFYAKHLRLAHIFPRSLDEPPNWAASQGSNASGTGLLGKIRDSRQDVEHEVRRRETSAILSEVLNLLSPRERIVVIALGEGKSLAEIGEKMGISKQAVHKISGPAFTKLKDKLSGIGYRGLDSRGFLKSSRAVIKRRPG